MINPTKFDQWLRNNGCEVLPTTNQYEVIRWKGKQVGIIYSTGKTNSAYAAKGRADLGMDVAKS